MSVPNMKFLCLTLWQGEVCTDDNNDDTDANANDDGQNTSLIYENNSNTISTSIWYLLISFH